MPHRLIPLLVVALIGNTAHAGPWLREKGSTFMEVSFASNYILDTTRQTYLEYGLSDKTTVIADIGMIQPRNAEHGGIATFSLRRALSAPDATSKWAYELGAGVGWAGDEILPHFRTGLSWGRGMSWGETSGWMTVDAAVIWDLTNAQHVSQLDATLGANFTDFTTGMIQIYTAHIDGASIVTLAPSVVFNPQKGGYRIKLGAESELSDWDNSAFKIGL
ncbi:hypothetical protein [Sulfitobacter sp.]|uniref:hypothetical protein n=1 Tax=Sulfitobacter sp. TaxID=1903071 RepID=UPI0030033D06